MIYSTIDYINLKKLYYKNESEFYQIFLLNKIDDIYKERPGINIIFGNEKIDY